MKRNYKIIKVIGVIVYIILVITFMISFAKWVNVEYGDSKWNKFIGSWGLYLLYMVSISIFLFIYNLITFITDKKYL